ncbi:MAG TPA: hypothetical protein VK611_09530 [Acidimicrobiales bacterium]|nr:hypothetical protein [Acidimicrobiales bacterium]
MLVGPGATIGDRRSQCLQLRFDVADADADDQPPLREDVDRGQLLGQQDRVPPGEDGDAGRQPHPAGHRRQVGQGDHELEARFVGRVRGIDRESHVVADPQGLEAGVLGPPCPTGQHVGIDAAALVEPVQPPPHDDQPPPTARCITSR